MELQALFEPNCDFQVSAQRAPVAPIKLVWGDAFWCTEVVADLVSKQRARPHLSQTIITNLTKTFGCKVREKSPKKV